ncbi:MAG: D-isomer specific 2-hydroxyacid dehydrogenase family protein [Actinomycetota bacterium]|nr:D-isomer specific 2-hydroxyacid dehydrogenase family protein [Actinomycetota bacterium]
MVKVAVAPRGTRDWICEAVRAGGGELVEAADAEALVWTDAAHGAGPQPGPAGLRETLDAYPQIKWVQLPWAGVEPYAAAGVFDDAHLWTCGKGVYARPVAEHALTLALAGLRDLKRFATASEWGDQAGISLAGGRVTIFGGGGIATELIALLAPFHCDITVVRRHPRPMDGVARVFGYEARYEALRGADLVVVACALTAETNRLISSVELELMAPHAWLVNVARGPHVVTEDLVVALRGDIIGGAALDVTNPEPLPPGHPLWALPNCVITPHTANTEDMAMPLLSKRITENVRRYAAGEPLLGTVDTTLGY